jgi:hypothetical protein
MSQELSIEEKAARYDDIVVLFTKIVEEQRKGMVVSAEIAKINSLISELLMQEKQAPAATEAPAEF